MLAHATLHPHEPRALYAPRGGIYLHSPVAIPCGAQRGGDRKDRIYSYRMLVEWWHRFAFAVVSSQSQQI
jgi:hypothetical protein